MDEAKAKPLPIVKVVEAVAIGILLLGAAAGIYGLGCVATGLWGLIGHGSFAGQPLWQFLHLQGPHYKFLRWDRSFFLIVGGFTLSHWANDGGDELVRWLSETPSQRAAARVAAKEKTELAAGNEKRRKEAEELERPRKRSDRLPMSGWRRLWIVLSILIGVPTLLIAYHDGSHVNAYITADQKIQSLTGQQFWDQLALQAKRERSELGSCIPATVRMEHAYEWSYSITCDRNDALVPALLWALLPAALMWAVGKTMRWIYRGFRPVPAASNAAVKEND